MSAIKSRRLNAYTQFAGHCFWCNRKVSLKKKHITAHFGATVDHLYPKGDARRRHNAYEIGSVLACRSCNMIRGDAPVEHFAIVAASVLMARRNQIDTTC